MIHKFTHRDRSVARSAGIDLGTDPVITDPELATREEVEACRRMVSERTDDLAIAMGLLNESEALAKHWKWIAFGWCTGAVISAALFVGSLYALFVQSAGRF